jgi:hypothetical protein
MFGMLERAPHVCFKVKFPSSVSAEEEISRALSSHLLLRFGAARAGLQWRGRRFVEFQLEQRLIWVGWYRNRRKDGEWILFVGPGDLPSLWDLLRGRRPVVYTEEFIRVSRDVHALLGSVDGVSNIKWYFREFRAEDKKGVWTPDELPWAERR